MKAIVSSDGWVLGPMYWDKLCRIDSEGIWLWSSREKKEILLSFEAIDKRR